MYFTFTEENVSRLRHTSRLHINSFSARKYHFLPRKDSPLRCISRLQKRGLSPQGAFHVYTRTYNMERDQVEWPEPVIQGLFFILESLFAKKGICRRLFLIPTDKAGKPWFPMISKVFPVVPKGFILESVFAERELFTCKQRCIVFPGRIHFCESFPNKDYKCVLQSLLCTLFRII